MHPRNELEIRVLAPKDCAIGLCGRQYDAVGHGKPVFDAHFGCNQGKRRRKPHDLPLLHQGHGLERRPLAALLQNAFEDLVKAQGRDQQIASGLNGGSEELGIGAVRKVFEPAG